MRVAQPRRTPRHKTESRMKETRTTRVTTGAVTACLVAAAAISFGFWFALALSGDDVGLMESPLLLSVARQLRFGPWELYGPFGRRNPLVLIHAPLYYRLAALAAWPLVAAGFDAVTAARLAGRALSILSLIVTAAAAYRLARRDGARKRAGWWAALLVVAAPVLGATAFSVRPDMMGVALQTMGVLLVVSCLQNLGRGRFKVTLAFALFGLAICTKQHLVVGPVISVGLLIAAHRRGEIALARIVFGLAIATAIVVVDYVIEQEATSGMMAAAVFRAAANVSRVHPGGWLHVATVLAAVLGNSAGLISLLGAAAAALGARLAFTDHAPLTARLFWSTAAALVASLACLTVLQLFVIRLWLGWMLLAAALLIVLFIVPAAALCRRLTSPPRLNTFLAIYFAGEVVLLIVLSRLSDGAWVNYAIQATVFAVVVTARALSRALEESPRPVVALVTIIAALAVPAAVCMDLKAEVTRRRGERAAVARLLQALGGPASAYFFAERPAFNRMVGHVELVYDDWLYPVFESTGLAESRSQWLGRALIAGGVRFVVTTADAPRVPAIETIPRAHSYRAAGRFGPFRGFEIVIPPIR